MKRLGIDLGTNSLGWAIFEDERMKSAASGSCAPSPIECGVIIFPEGMDRDDSNNLASPAAKRRAKRAARRLIYRRKLRKFHLLRVLMEHGMCPLSEEGLNQWKEKGIYPLEDEPFMNWLRSTPEQNPYADRNAAACEKVDNLILGRALYHIAQRRGFKSSRKEQLAEMEAEEDSGVKGNHKKTSQPEQGVIKRDIQALTAELNKEKLTLGQYFYRMFEKNYKEPASADRIRGRHTGRIEHYEKEFNQIADTQELSADLRESLHRILFFQRPLRIQRHLVGWCALEKGRPYVVPGTKTGETQRKVGHKYRRCLMGHPEYERFRALAFMNNLRISEIPPAKHEVNGTDTLAPHEGRKLSPEERAQLFEKLTRKIPCTVDNLLKGFLEKKTRCYSNYRPSADAPIMPIRARLLELGLHEALWQRALNALYTFDDTEKLRAWAQKPTNEHGLGLDENKAKTFIRLTPSEERAAYSLHAIRKILPFLEKGFTLRKAIFCAKLPDIVKDFPKYKQEILDGLEACEQTWAKEKEQACTAQTPRKPAVHSLEGFHYRNFLKTKWSVTDEQFEQLYVDTSHTDRENPILPPVDLNAIRNPLATRALTVLRRLINLLRQKRKIDADTHIFIELARTVNSANMCRAIEKWQTEQQKRRKEAKAFLEEERRQPLTDELILRYMLWKEQDARSVYTGQPIPQKGVWSPDYEIEHTIPRSRGGTSEQWNLTLCEKHYNTDIKKEKLPSECPNAEHEWRDPDNPNTPYPTLSQSAPFCKWKNELGRLEKSLEKKPRRNTAGYAQKRQAWLVLKLKRDYLARKLDTFKKTAEDVDNAGFIPRQLVDTGIITKFAIKYLKQRYAHVFPRNGATTATARKLWGLLQKDEEKSRDNHIHHAVDACVIAALDHTAYATLCARLKTQDEKGIQDETVPPPYPDFASRVQQAAAAILIRHLPANKQLHPFGTKTCRIPPAVIQRLKKENRPIPVPPKTSVVRGKLHDDTLYGKISDNGEEKTVIRKPLADLLAKIKAERKDAPLDLDTVKKSIADALKDIVDARLRECLIKQVMDYVTNGVNGKDLVNKPYYAPRARTEETTLSPIPVKKVRIFCGHHPKNPDVIRKPNSNSVTYGSGSDALCLVIKTLPGGKWDYQYISLLYATKTNNSIPSTDDGFIIHKYQLALTYETSPSELKSLSPQELTNRLYVVRQVEDKGKIYLIHCQNAQRREYLPQKSSTINYKKPQEKPFLCLSLKTYQKHLLFEGVHFTLSLDGELSWLTDLPV